MPQEPPSVDDVIATARELARVEIAARQEADAGAPHGAQPDDEQASPAATEQILELLNRGHEATAYATVRVLPPSGLT